MNTCESCKHWQPPAERTDFSNPIDFAYRDGAHSLEERENAQINADTQYGICGEIVMSEGQEIGEPLPLAVTMDGSQYRADLFTRFEFGCVLWKEKENHHDEPLPNLY